MGFDVGWKSADESVRGDRIRRFLHGGHVGEGEIKNDEVLDLEAVAWDLGIWILPLSSEPDILQHLHPNFLRWKEFSSF